MHHKQTPEVYLNQAVVALQKQPNDSAALHKVSQDLSEVVSLERFEKDSYFNVFYGVLQYILWKEQCDIWNERKRLESQSRSARGSMYSWNNDADDESEDDVDGGGGGGFNAASGCEYR